MKAPHSIWTNPIHFIACGFGIGASPIAPGTLGTLLGVVLYLALKNLPVWEYISITLALIIIGIPLCQITNRDFGTEDHPAAVWDEIASFPLVMIAIPFTWYYLALGFILFRIFDILKPGVIGKADRSIHGGFGVMFDDVLAALLSWLILISIVGLIHFFR